MHEQDHGKAGIIKMCGNAAIQDWTDGISFSGRRDFAEPGGPNLVNNDNNNNYCRQSSQQAPAGQRGLPRRTAFTNEAEGRLRQMHWADQLGTSHQ